MMHTITIERAVSHTAGAVVMLMSGAALAAGVSGQGTWETTLLGRDIQGNAVASNSESAVFLYDTVLHVTWLRDANVNGEMPWKTANSWANNLVVGTFSGWRLPTMIDAGAPGCEHFGNGSATDCGYNVQTKSGDPKKYEQGQTVFSEMAHLY